MNNVASPVAPSGSMKRGGQYPLPMGW